MRTFRLTLEYDGTDFEGWQVQPAGRRTIQGSLEAAIARITSKQVRVTGSGRTDAGVHADGQVASLVVETPLAPEDLRRALNGVLPPDLAVLEVALAPEGWNARRDAVSKLYRYSVWNGASRSPLRRRRVLCLERPLDLPAMRRAAEALVGHHDFVSFQGAGSNVATTDRTLLRLDIRGEAGRAMDFWFEGTGFLRHMVRNLMGTLLEVGSGRRSPDEMAGILAARDRRLAGPTAAAHALTLVAVRYASEPRDVTTPGVDSPVGSAAST